MKLDKKQWGDKFEVFLMDKHAEQYIGVDDDMPDDFSNWLQELDPDEIIEYAGEFALKISEGKIK